MATGKTLGFILTDTCIEAGISTQAALMQDVREPIKRFIVNEQERLIDEFNWLPFIGDTDGKFFDIELAAGERFYDWPDGFDWKTLAGVWYDFSGTWLPLHYGIEPHDYSAFSPDADDRSEPTQKWDYHTEQQIELWPTPIADGGVVRLKGRALATMPTAESQVCVIDHILLAKFAAASYLRTKPDENGEIRKLADRRYAEATGRLNTLKARRNKHRLIHFGQCRVPDPMDPRFRIRVVG